MFLRKQQKREFLTFPLPFTSKIGHKTFLYRFPCYTWRPEASLSLTRKRYCEDWIHTVLAKSPHFTSLTSHSLTHHISPDCPHCIRFSIKIYRFNCFPWSSFPYEASQVTENLLHELICFLLLICSRQLNLQTQPETWRESKETFSFPMTVFQKIEKSDFLLGPIGTKFPPV